MAYETETDRFVELSDQKFSDIYRPLEGMDKPAFRHLLLAYLLGHPDHDLVTVQSKENLEIIHSLLEETLGPSMDDLLLTDIRHGLRDLFKDTTYSVASYWSPLDTTRRSVIKWQKDGDSANQNRLAAALLFYQMTNIGRKFDPPQTTVIHYLSRFAEFKRGIQISFENEDVTQHVLSIGKHAEYIWKRTGLDARIDRISRMDGGDTLVLEAALHNIINATRNPTPDIVSEQAYEAFKNINQIIDSISRDEFLYLNDVKENMNLTFHNDRCGPITTMQASMFVMSSILWRKAVGESNTQFMYAFPTSVHDTCCILSLGINRSLTSSEKLQISHISQSAFVQPLMQDYRLAAKREIGNRHNNVFRRLFGHNFPKIFIRPSKLEVLRMEKTLSQHDSDDLDLQKPIERIKMLLLHYESFLGAVMSADKISEDFQRNQELINLDEQVWKYVPVVFDYAREASGSEVLRQNTKLQFNHPKGISLLGHPGFVREVIFNLITNAVTKLPPPIVKDDTSRGLIEIYVRIDKTRTPNVTYLSFTIRDRGNGFNPGSLDEIQRIEQLFAAKGQDERDRDDFWSAVSDEVEWALAHKANEEDLGIGLIFCLAYLRSLEWSGSAFVSGKLEIVSNPGAGVDVTILVPGAIEDESMSEANYAG